jgi:hypothetical protein
LILPVPAAMQEINKAAREKKKKKIYTELYVASKRDATVHPDADDTLNKDLQGENAYVYVYIHIYINICILQVYIYIYIYIYI